MIRLTLLFVFLAPSVWGQTELDYQLYSSVIQNYVEQGIKRQIATSEVVIIQKFLPKENEVSLLVSADEQTRKMFLQNDTSLINLFANEQVRKGILILEAGFFKTPTLKEDEFHLERNVTVLTAKQFNRYFKSLFGNQIDKGWKKFYKKHPGAHAVFEFSQIVYQGDYACFYVGRHSNGLSGSGNLVVAKKQNDSWIIVSYFNIWMA